MKNIVLITQVGISMMTPILVGLFLGYGLDKFLKLNGVFSVILLILGVFSGFMNTYRLIMKYNSGPKKGDKDEGK